MPRFVKGEIDEVKKTVSYVVRRQGGKNEFPSPDKKYEKDKDPATEEKGVHFWLNGKDKSLEKGALFRDLLFFCTNVRSL
jgi:hypothetical protein